MVAFIFGGDTKETPETIKRKREIARALMAAQGAPRNVGEGLNALGDGIVAAVLDRRAEAAEKSGLEAAAKDFAPIASMFGGGGQAAATQSAGIPSPETANEISATSPNPYRDAIASIESAGSGDYAAVGPTHPKMGRALGRYQVMEANIGPWSQEALGRAVTPDEFLADPKLQDTIFDHKFNSYVGQYGPEGAAQAWFAGPGGVGKVDRKDSLGTSVGAYGDKFTKALGGNAQVAQALTSQPQQSQQVDTGAIMKALSNPFLPEGQRAVAEALMQQESARRQAVVEQQLKQQDPKYQLDLQKGQIEVENLRNPRISPAEQARIDADKTRLGFDREKFAADQQNNALTPEIKEYNFYAERELAAGRQPLGPLEWDVTRRKSSANNTSVSVGGEPSDGNLRKKLDEKTGELWSTYQEQGATSAGASQDFQVLDELIKVAPQGPIQGRLAEMFPGVSSAGDAFQSIVKRVAPTLRAPGSGATSDIEYDGMLKSLPALRNKPEANQAINAIMKAKAAINVERSGIIDQYGRGEITAGEARSKISDIDRRSIMSPELKKAFEGVGVVEEAPAQANVPSAGALEDGYRFKGGNPSDPNNWEKVQ